MARRYQYTARRRAALRKAQLASARKRSRNKKIKRAVIVGGATAAVLGASVARHKASGSKIGFHGKGAVEINGKRIGKPGISLTRHKGFVVQARIRTKKGDALGYYSHNRVKTREVAGQTAKVLGQKLPESTRYRLAYATRGIRGKGNPFAAQYDPKSGLNYGSYGKRLPRVDRYIKTRGGKAVKEMGIG